MTVQFIHTSTSEYITQTSTSSYPGFNSQPFTPTMYPTTTTTGLMFPTLPDLLAPNHTPRNSLTTTQLDKLLLSHEFIAMDGNDFCLFCYALDMYRTRTLHQFVIHEQ